MRILLDKNKNYYKANLHGHTSTYSDGAASIEKVKAEYKKRGYSVIAFTDHEHIVDNSHLNDDDFLTITSTEIAIKEFPKVSTLVNRNMAVVHLNFYSRDPHNVKTPCYSRTYDKYFKEEFKDIIFSDGEYDRKYTPEGINEIIKEANKEGFLVSYNHPTWSLDTPEHYMKYEGLWAVEIYNHDCQRQGLNNDEAVFEYMLRDGKKVFCTACDDNHNFESFDSQYTDSFGGWCMINSEKLDYDTIFSSLEKGEFYASTGPEILSLIEDGGIVRVETSPAGKIALITRSRRRHGIIAEKGETITSAEFKLDSQDGYFRIRVEDENGKIAWSQAYEI